MPAYKINIKTLKNINANDRLALWAIALHRCLTSEQLEKFVYKNMGYCKKSIGKLLTRGFIKPVVYGDNEIAYFITAKGTATLKTFEAMAEKSETEEKDWDIRDEISIKNYENNMKFPFGIKPESFPLKPHELSMLAAKIPHQIALNDFALSFHEMAREKGYYSYRYLDEGYIAREIRLSCNKIRRDDSRCARPDAMLRIYDQIYYIENDMNSEQLRQLREKWQKYLNFMRYIEDFGDDTNHCLFSLAKCPNTRRRKNSVISSLSDIAQLPSANLDIIVEPPEDLLRYIFDQLEQRETTAAGVIKYMLAQGAKTVQLPQDGYHDFFEGVLEINGELRLIDSYEFTRCYVLKKAVEFARIRSLLAMEFKMPIRYIIVARDVAMLKHDLGRLGGAAAGVEIVSAEDVSSVDAPETLPV